MPNWYGLASGEPFMLSILSSLRGNRIAVFGYAGVLGGNIGLNVALDGGRGGGRELVLEDGFEGEAGLEGARPKVDVPVPVLNGGLDFWGLGEAGGIRPIVPIVRDCDG